ncbi:synaptonemal complex protein 3 [Parambassis ranga]|uniref:Synaptonemal complex protein 3 n=1 Tax=Parambassis ranga TaxID=210632 RepID=A0A6P7K9Q4_9TELE|nr:synaptonemal complex protein 3 [Parambassis ranga]
MATGRRQMRKKLQDEGSDQKIFDFTAHNEEEELGAVGGEETPKMHKVKKRPAAELKDEARPCAVGNEVQSMLEKFGVEINKEMQAKRKRLESLTKNYTKGSQQKLEQLWSTYLSQRQKMTQQYSQQVSSALQQWETEAQRAEEQEQQLNNLFRQQQKILQQARVVLNQKLKTVRELYEQFVKNMEDLEKSQEAFQQGAQQELRKEMATLQKKILMDMQQHEMAKVRQSLQTMLF